MTRALPPNRLRGFTLLELLLAMSMVAMLALTLYTAMSVALRARKSAEAAVEPTRTVTVVADMIREDFEGVLPPTGILAGQFIGTRQGGATGGGSGDADTVEFCSLGADPQPANDDPLAEGIRRVEFILRTDVTPSVLIRRVTRNLLATSEPPIEEEVLARDVRSFSLRYFDGYTWQESWDSTAVDNVLPVAVAFTIELNEPGLQAGQPSSRKVTRIVPMACGKPSDSFSAAMGVTQ